MTYHKNMFDKLNEAFRKGQESYKKNLSRMDNPYPKPNDKTTKSFSEYSEWDRGWSRGLYSKRGRYFS